MGARNTEKIGLTCSDSIFLDSLPVAYPAINTTCIVSPVIGNVDFTVISTNKEKNTVTIREHDGEIEYILGIDVFDLLLVSKKQPTT